MKVRSARDAHVDGLAPGASGEGSSPSRGVGGCVSRSSVAESSPVPLRVAGLRPSSGAGGASTAPRDLLFEDDRWDAWWRFYGLVCRVDGGVVGS